MTTRAQGIRRLVEAETAAGEVRRVYVNHSSRLADVLPIPRAPWLSEDDRTLFLTDVVDLLVFDSQDQPVWALQYDDPDGDGLYDRAQLHLARVCAALNLPLVRVQQPLTDLPVEQEVLLRWMVRRWLIYRDVAPAMYAERDAQIEQMSEEELAATGPWLLAERPDLDVEFIFDLDNPFPPLQRLVDRLAAVHRCEFHVDGVRPSDAARAQMTAAGGPLWTSGPFMPAVWDMRGGPESTRDYEHQFIARHSLVRPDAPTELGHSVDLEAPSTAEHMTATGCWSALVLNPLTEGGIADAEFVRLTLDAERDGVQALPMSGPPDGFDMHVLGRAMATYRAVADLEEQLTTR